MSKYKPKNLFKGSDGSEYTLSQIKRANSRIEYWIIFPQGIERTRKGYTMLSSMMIAKTQKKAIRLWRKYDGAWVERLITCDLGRWSIRLFTDDLRWQDELWDAWMNKPKIIL